MIITDHIGQITETSLAALTAQCDLNHPPPLGSLTAVDDPEGVIFAVVCDAATASLDPGRHPVARGAGEDVEELYRHNPHLPHLLRTTFTATVVGHIADGTIRHYLPPRPARLYAPVRSCSEEQVLAFTRDLSFLRLLLTASANADETVAACLRLAAPTHADPRTFLVGAGRELALLTAADPQRLSAILQRIRP